MSFIRSTMALLLGMAVGGALLMAYRVSQETGKSFPDAIMDVPGEAMRVYDDLRSRATEAVKTGRQAYREKQSEVEAGMRGSTQAE
jgi:hypothetical protein